MNPDQSAPLADTAPSETPAPQTPSAPAETPSAEANANADSGNIDPRNLQATPPPTDPDAYQIPEAYQRRELEDGKIENAWTDKVKSEEDLWKLAANSQEMIGKKHALPDFDNATPQEVEAYFNQVRPADKADYNFNLNEGQDLNGLGLEFAELLHSSGIPKFQGDQMIAKYQAMEAAKQEASFDTESFMEGMSEHFGKNYKEDITSTRELIESNLNDDQKKTFAKVPNDHLTLMYQLASNMAEAYGASEDGHGGMFSPGIVPSKSFEDQRTEIGKQMDELKKTPFYSGEKMQELINARQATFDAQVKQQTGRK